MAVVALHFVFISGGFRTGKLVTGIVLVLVFTCAPSSLPNTWFPTLFIWYIQCSKFSVIGLETVFSNYIIYLPTHAGELKYGMEVDFFRDNDDAGNKFSNNNSQ